MMDSIERVKITCEVLKEQLEDSETGYADARAIKHVLDHVLDGE